MKENKLWFKAKNYGWGWYPASWQGWLVMAWYLIALVIIFRKINPNVPLESNRSTAVIPFLIVTAILIFICYKTGEKPEWRWGKKENLPQ